MTEQGKGAGRGRDMLAIAVFVLFLAAVAAAVGFVTGRGSAKETQIVRDAVRQAAMTCYAVEGSYPDSVTYLRENYGLAYDESRYLVIYDAFASNLMPDIRVLETGNGK